MNHENPRTAEIFLLEPVDDLVHTLRTGKITEQFTDHGFHHGIRAGSATGDQYMSRRFIGQIAAAVQILFCMKVVVRYFLAGNQFVGTADIIRG